MAIADVRKLKSDRQPLDLTKTTIGEALKTKLGAQFGLQISF
ncbi:MAG: hypothetical protein V7L20_29045 [Nostoc sp.]